jgi:LDH2 family malate/lactate/ureidoglycolate dehydrogenase
VRAIDGEILLPDSRLREIARRILVAAGASENGAALAADAMVAANLRGVDSHGVQLLSSYVKQIESGGIDGRAEGRVASESGATMVYDGANAMGHVVSDACCTHAARLARSHGLGMVVARNSNHFGAAAYWARKISEERMIGIVMCNSSPRVPPWQGKEGRFGTNPLCVSLPVEPPDSWLLDMATTTVAANKIYNLVAKGGDTIPPGWAMDSDGAPTTDAQTAIRGLLMPLGGYKGSGLAMMVEILCAVLSGGAMSTEVGGLYITDRHSGTSQMFLAIEVGRFMPPEEFAARARQLVAHTKTVAPAKGYDEVLVAGDPEWRAEKERLREGIPLAADLWEKIEALAARLGVAVE